MENNIRYLDPVGLIKYEDKSYSKRSRRYQVTFPQALGPILLVGERLVSTGINLFDRYNTREKDDPYWISLTDLTKEIYVIYPQPYKNLKMGPTYQRLKKSLCYQENIIRGLRIHLDAVDWGVGKTNIDPKTGQLLDDDYVWVAPAHHMNLWIPKTRYD